MAARRFHLGEDEEPDRRGEDEQDASHGRSALLRLMSARAVVPDVLAEAQTTEDRDEPRSEKHREDRREDAGGENVRHVVAGASVTPFVFAN